MLRKFVKLAKSAIFEVNCILYDVKHVVCRIVKNKSFKCDTDVAFICSLSFFEKNKWQVASQKELWERFLEDTNAIVCGSFISYIIFGLSKKHVISLEPGWNAPKVKFSNRHSKVLVTISDAHSKQWLPDYLLNNNITHIVTPYKKNLLKTGFNGFIKPENIISFPWCISEHVMNQPIFDPENTYILGFGKTGGNVYDLRDWAFNTKLLQSYDYAGSGNKKFSGDAYYKWLREYPACVVAVSSFDLYNCTVAKYFEVPSQGLLLFAFETVDLSDFGFKDGVNCIIVNKDNFHSEISKFRDNPNQYDVIRENGYKLIRDYHTVSNRIKCLRDVIC